MPTRPLRPCPAPGCAALTTGGRCEAHQVQRQQAQDAARGSAAARGYGKRWQTYRAAFLRKHPLCAHCQAEGRTTAARVVDHIEPHRGDQVKFWDKRNHQPLCIPCHNTKTAREDGGFGNRARSTR